MNYFHSGLNKITTWRFFLRKYNYLTLIIIIAALLRFFDLSGNPPGVFTDELIPFVIVADLMRGFGIYYTTTVPPSVTFGRVIFGEYQSLLVFGDSTLAIRFPGALYGTLLVLFTYLMIRALFNERLALWSSFLLAISPWAIQASRVFYMNQIQDSLTLLVLGVWLFWTGLSNERPNRPRLYSSYIVFGICIGYFFTGDSRFPAAILFALLLFYAYRTRKGNWTSRDLQNLFLYSFTVIGFFLIDLPLLSVGSISQVSGNAQFYFGSQNILLTGGWKGVETFFARYVQYFMPRFLFISGDPDPSQNTGLTGEMLYPSLIFLYLGMVVSIRKIIKRQRDTFTFLLIWIWMVAAPVEISAYLFGGYTDSSAAMLMMPGIQIFSALGIITTIDFLSKRDFRLHHKFQSRKRVGNLKYSRFRKLIAAVIVTSFLLSSSVFLNAYFIIHPNQMIDNPYSQWGQMYGFPQVARYIAQHHLYILPVYVSPDGLFANNASVFHFYFYVWNTPQNFLDYYSNGLIENVKVANPYSFYSPVTSLIISGSSGDLNILRQSGDNAKIIYNVTRPDGSLAVTLIEVIPGINSQAMNYMRSHSIYSIQNISSYDVVNTTALSNISENFTLSVWFNVTNQSFASMAQYGLVNTNTPAFSVGFWAERYFVTGGSNTTMLPQEAVYSDIGNYSLPNSWERMWANTPIEHNTTYLLTITDSNGTVRFYVNGTLWGETELNYPLYPPGDTLTFDANVHADLMNVSIWNASLPSGDIGYLYYNVTKTLQPSYSTLVGGIMYGFPQVADYITGHDMYNLPIYVSPDGLFNNSTSAFNYWFYYYKTPQNFLDYYSNGLIENVKVANPYSFYSPVTSLIISGSSGDLNILRQSGDNPVVRQFKYFGLQWGIVS